jgi:hypothetical protein
LLIDDTLIYFCSIKKIYDSNQNECKRVYESNKPLIFFENFYLSDSILISTEDDIKYIDILTNKILYEYNLRIENSDAKIMSIVAD